MMSYRPNLRILIERLLKSQQHVHEVHLTLGRRAEFPRVHAFATIQPQTKSMLSFATPGREEM